MTYKGIFTLIVLLSFNLTLIAHAKTEIGFKVTEEDHEVYLEVHLTTLTLFDILYHLHPELQSQSSLNLSQYVSDYESYFNQHIDLKLNKEGQKLTYQSSNLIVHDATIKFLVQNFEDKIHTHQITIGGFDFYKKPSFTVMLETSTLTDTCFLSKTDHTCSGTNQDTAGQNNEFYWLVALCPLVLLLGLVWKKRLSYLER